MHCLILPEILKTLMQNTTDLGNMFLNNYQSAQVYDTVSSFDNFLGFLINNFQILILYLIVFSIALSIPFWFLVFYFKRQIKNLDEEETATKEPKGKVAQILDP